MPQIEYPLLNQPRLLTKCGDQPGIDARWRNVTDADLTVDTSTGIGYINRLDVLDIQRGARDNG